MQLKSRRGVIEQLESRVLLSAEVLLVPGAPNAHVVPAGDRIYVLADDQTHGVSLWRSDGTKSGTMLVKTEIGGTAVGLGQAMLAVGSGIYFVVGNNDSQTLWHSDGTDTGTVPC